MSKEDSQELIPIEGSELPAGENHRFRRVMPRNWPQHSFSTAWLMQSEHEELSLTKALGFGTRLPPKNGTANSLF